MQSLWVKEEPTCGYFKHISVVSGDFQLLIFYTIYQFPFKIQSPGDEK